MSYLKEGRLPSYTEKNIPESVDPTRLFEEYFLGERVSFHPDLQANIFLQTLAALRPPAVMFRPVPTDIHSWLQHVAIVGADPSHIQLRHAGYYDDYADRAYVECPLPASGRLIQISFDPRRRPELTIFNEQSFSMSSLGVSCRELEKGGASGGDISGNPTRSLVAIPNGTSFIASGDLIVLSVSVRDEMYKRGAKDNVFCVPEAYTVIRQFSDQEL